MENNFEYYLEAIDSGKTITKTSKQIKEYIDALSKKQDSAFQTAPSRVKTLNSFYQWLIT